MKRSARKGTAQDEDNDKSSGISAGILIGIGIVLTVLILAVEAKQISAFGDWPPFTVKAEEDGLSLGETGDFIGGWANSLALVWLVVVAGLQFIALNVQRAELRHTRKELKETRGEIEKQVALMEAQTALINSQTANSNGMLELERKRTAVDFVLKARPLLRELLIEGLYQMPAFNDRKDLLRNWPIRELITSFSIELNEAINTNSPQGAVRHQIRKLADDTMEITNLFDAIAHHAAFLGDDTLYKSLIELRDVAMLYRRCEILRKAVADYQD